MSAAAIKPLARRSDTLVAVRPIKLGGNEAIDVGDVIEAGDYPAHRKSFWWRLGWVGPKGHPWTERQLAKWTARISKEKGARAAKSVSVEVPAPAALDSEAPLLGDDTGDSAPPAAPAPAKPRRKASAKKRKAQKDAAPSGE